MCRIKGLVRAWSAIAGLCSWRIHQVAYVENLYPRLAFELIYGIFIKAMVAFLNLDPGIAMAIGIFFRNRTIPYRQAALDDILSWLVRSLLRG